MKRFNHDAETADELKNYIKNRAIQLLSEDVELVQYKEETFGATVDWKYKDTTWNSVYLYPKYRGQGLYLKKIKDDNLKILTVPDCDLESFLKLKNIEHIVLNNFITTPEYKMISNYYGDDCAKRSKVYLMNHIDEGLAILTGIGASETTKKAYCLHPIVQSDGELSQNFQKDFSTVDPQALILAMEYRHIANDYLSFKSIKELSEIKFSPLNEVQEMLIADKIQNYKDFLLFHKESHARSTELTQYFENWLAKLNAKELFINYAKKLTIIDF